MADTSWVSRPAQLQVIEFVVCLPSWEQLEETVLGLLPEDSSAKLLQSLYARLLCQVFPGAAAHSFLEHSHTSLSKSRGHYLGKAKMHGPELPSADPGVGPGIRMCTVASVWHIMESPTASAASGISPQTLLAPGCQLLPSAHPLNPSKPLVLLAHPHSSTEARLCSAFGWLTAPRLDGPKPTPRNQPASPPLVMPTLGEHPAYCPSQRLGYQT